MTDLPPGTLVGFRPGSPPWDAGARRGTVVGAVLMSTYLRAMRDRLPDLLGPHVGTVAEAGLATGGDRTMVIVRFFPCRRFPVGLEVMVADEWLVELAGADTWGRN